MHRTTLCLHLVAGLAAFAALPLAALPSRADATGPSAWRFRTEHTRTAPRTVTVTQSGNFNWFLARDASGKTVRVLFPTRSGAVARDGRMIPASSLRPGDQVEVWGEKHGASLFASHARVVSEKGAAEQDRR